MKFSGNFQLTGNYSAGGSGASVPAFTGTLSHILVDSDENTFSEGVSVGMNNEYTIVGVPATGGVANIYDTTSGNLVRTLINPNSYNGTSNNDQFGCSVAISGDKAIVGAWLEDDAFADNSGAAYIFDVATGNLLHTLTGILGSADRFGEEVAISNNYALVGIPQHTSGTGEARLYDAQTGNLLYTFSNPNPSTNELFGCSVAVSDTHALIGAHRDDAFSGMAYIFDVTTGNLLHTITNPNVYGGATNDNFGYSVAINGNLGVISAYWESDAGGARSGAAYIFDVTTGNLLHTLTNPNAYGTSADDNFGWSVAISNDIVVVSALVEDDAGGTDSGAVYVFDVSTGNLLHTLTNPNVFGTSTSDYFGVSVAVSGTTVAVGARGEDVGGTTSGVAYIYN